MKTLPINLQTFGFVKRETVKDKIVKNKCGRDFLYYCLTYYYPDKFNVEVNNPVQIDNNKLFGFLGLLDHVLFVYGFDEENLYVFDTHQVPVLEYEKITQDNRYIMKISKNIIKKRWSRFGRVWIIKRQVSHLRHSVD